MCHVAWSLFLCSVVGAQAQGGLRIETGDCSNKTRKFWNDTVAVEFHELAEHGPWSKNFPPGFDRYCMRDTGGTCQYMSCDSSRGPTYCKNNKCYCQDGHCAINGYCASHCYKNGCGPGECKDHEWKCRKECEPDTGGTCAWLSCKSWRGYTKCVDGKCLCHDGYCSESGTCIGKVVPKRPLDFDLCVKDTGGTCAHMDCNSDRGPTECVDGKCMCAWGFCAVGGTCVNHCRTDTAGTCAHLSCNADRGPTDCVDGACQCQEGTCADLQLEHCAHQCEKDTLGTCRFLSCSSWHGPTNCVDGKCLCMDNQCSQAGKCVPLPGAPPLPATPPGFEDACVKDTTGTCKLLGCSTSRGATDCISGKCVCQFGYCAVNGECVDKCETETTGTCEVMGCSSSRGPTDCVDGKCVCQAGTCADHSKHSCAHPCEPDTGGTCKWLACSSSRGPTVCHEGKCLCQEAYCSEAGTCVKAASMKEPTDPDPPNIPAIFQDTCQKDTGGTCAHLSCSSSRGPVDCIDGKCVCQYGYCAVSGSCVNTCSTETTGTCEHLDCNTDRGPVDCVDGKCVCQEGTCADFSQYSCSHPCEEDSGGTCKWLACKSSRGPTACIGGKCLCQAGYCSQSGTCLQRLSMVNKTEPNPPIVPETFKDVCQKDTGGTCKNFPCKSSRGQTACINGKCICEYGYCAVNGECVGTCETETTGTCAITGCNTDRGPVDCVDDKCICKEGTCADHSKYACAHPCESDSGGTCQWLACKSSRGPTNCIEGKCICQADYCAQAGLCLQRASGVNATDPDPPNIPVTFEDTCQKDTGGTCSHFSCSSSRGPVECIDGKCVCQYGYCAVSGTCVNTCKTETTGTCEHLDCYTDRGQVDCVDGKCVCQEGTCADFNQYSCSHPCEEDSGGTCKWLACKSSRGPTACIGGKCLCQAGYCSQTGTCMQRISMVNKTEPDPPNVPEIFKDICQKDTGGTCTVLACKSSRGPTACIDGKCVCEYGYCAVNGECVNTCETETTGTCAIADCNTDRGPVDCVDGKCICQEGTCADHSKYACAHPCEADSGGTCNFFACKSSRGPTKCHEGKCICQDGYCAQAGLCIQQISGVNATDPDPPNIPVIFQDTCQKDTGGTCSTLSCSSSRGPVDCIDGKCVCQYGYCAVSGTCVNTCGTATTGTCEHLDCNADRGPVDCVDGKCVCQEGTCADFNQYSCSHPCEEDSGGTCKWLACKSSRGPTTCVDGKCICQAGYCSQTGTCMQRISMMNHTEPDPPIIPEIFKDTCQKDTGGTCTTFACKSSRGRTACIDGKCVCEYGYCAVNGQCVNSCDTETTGTCSTLNCNTDRGPVDCVDGKCICQEGTCADHSKYACAHPCESDSGGTCAWLACRSSRGPTNCVDGKCICQEDHCAQAGLCIKKVSGVEPTDPDPPNIPEIFADICMKDTGGTCAEVACYERRGPTDCIDGKCLCKFGYCSVNGECVNTCGKETQGTCANMDCWTSRGSVDCVDGKCVCQEGACSDNSNYACSPPCATKTGGTCRVFGCSEWRGATDCVDGHCHCKEDYCAVGEFGKRSCKWKYSGMRNPSKSAVQKKSNSIPAKFRLSANRGTRLLGRSSPMVVAALAGLAAALLTIGIAVSASILCRRRSLGARSLGAREPLLAEAASAAC